MEKYTYEDNIKITITSQAIAILSRSKHTVEELKDWIKTKHEYSFGGHNVSIFLEQEARKIEQKLKEEKNKRTVMGKANK